jgi:hypothetical protein
MRGERPLASAAFAGTFLGVAFLSGHHQIPTFIALMAGGLWAKYLWDTGWQGAKPIAVFGLFLAMVSAAQVLPAVEAGNLSLRWVGAANPVHWNDVVPYTVHEHFSLLPLAILGLVLPSVTPLDVYVGLSVVMLALIGLAHFIRDRQALLTGAIGLGGLLFALGTYSVFHGVVYRFIPMVEKARVPTMALVIVQFALAVLAAYGLDAMRTQELGKGWVKALLILGSPPLAMAVAMVSLRPESSREYERLAILGLTALALAALFHGWRNLPGRTAVMLVLVAALFEWGSFTGYNYRTAESPAGFLAQLGANSDIAAFLRQQKDFVRLEVNLEDVPYNFGDWEEIDAQRAYLAGLTTNVTGAPDEAFSMNYALSKEPMHPNQQEVFRGSNGLRVFRNPGALPFVRLLNSCGGNAQLAAKRNTKFTIDSRAACAGTVVLSETYFPGWEALVDGHVTPIREMFGAIQGVDVAAGQHRIVFRYRPLSIYLGGAMSLIGLSGALAIAIIGRRRGAL